jgi:hypothetical protein
VDTFEGRTIQLLHFVPFTGEIIGTLGNKGIVTWKHNPFTAIATLYGSDDVIEALSYSKEYSIQF